MGEGYMRKIYRWGADSWGDWDEKKAVVDIDGVIADLMPVMRAAADEEADRLDWSSLDCWHQLSFDESEFWRRFASAGGYVTAKLIAQASEIIRQMRQAGWEVTVATARATETDPMIMFGLETESDIKQETAKWLKNNGVEYDQLLFVENKQELEAALFIDDQIDQFPALSMQDDTLRLIFKQSWNSFSTVGVLETARDWADIQHLLEIGYLNPHFRGWDWCGTGKDWSERGVWRQWQSWARRVGLKHLRLSQQRPKV